MDLTCNLNEKTGNAHKVSVLQNLLGKFRKGRVLPSYLYALLILKCLDCGTLPPFLLYASLCVVLRYSMHAPLPLCFPSSSAEA